MTFLIPNNTDNNVVQDLETLDQRLEGLLQCANRLGIEATDASTWTSMLSDLVALAGALHMTSTEAVPRLQTKSVVPYEPTLDINLFNEIPNMLAVVKPPDDIRELQDTPKVPMDVLKRRLKAQVNVILDGIKVVENANASYLPPPSVSKMSRSVYMQQKDVQEVQNVIAAIFSGTTREQF